jgi:hypothetical protein
LASEEPTNHVGASRFFLVPLGANPGICLDARTISLFFIAFFSSLFRETPKTFFVLSRFQEFLSDGSSKTLQKAFAKKTCRNAFAKQIDKTIQNRFFLDVCLSRFGAFLGEGSPKTR